MLTQLYEWWSNNNNNWENSEKTTYTYDQNNNRLTELYEQWFNNNWSNNWRHTYTYDQNNNRLTEFLENWYGYDNSWHNENKYTYTYDENNNCSLAEYQVWTGGISHIMPIYYNNMQSSKILNGDPIRVTINYVLVRSAETEEEFEISLTATLGGTVSGSGTYQAGTQHTVTATANSGYTFINWIENGQVVSQAANYSFTVTGNRTLTAVFQETETDISDIDVPDDVDIMVVPDSISARIVWRANEDATGYILIIYSDANHTNIICYLEFDSDGRLIGIIFGKSSENKADQGIFATRINNLTESTTYYYTMNTVGENNEIIDSKTGNFTTTSSTVGINDYETSKTNYVVFPNPTSGQLRITNYESSIGEIEVYDISGRLINNYQLKTDNSIDISH
jgi:hypothetical protein